MRRSEPPFSGHGIGLRLTGRPQTFSEGSWQDLPLDLGAAILFYLGVMGTWRTRAELATLFWAETTERDALRRLRQHLTRLKGLGWAADLEVERGRLRWAPTSDLAAFDRAWGEGRVLDALDHYHGPLLDDLRIDRAAGFAEWLHAERRARHDRWRQAAFEAVDEAMGARVTIRDAELMTAVRRADPFDEDALRRELTLLSALGRRETARRTFERYEAWLESEAGVSPEPDTLAVLAAMERASGTIEMRPASPEPTAVPVFDAPLVGRSRLLARVMQRLEAEDGPRLVTLWGPGGIGKTHLATRIAAQWDARATRTSVFAPIEHATNERGIFRGIADAMRIAEESPTALGRALHQRVGLLVLDNLEQVSGAGRAVAQVLAHAPRLRVLATSRRVLADVVGESIRVPHLEVGGASPLEETSLGLRDRPAEATEAEMLFMQRARRRNPDVGALLDVDAEARAALGRIVAMTGGLPLALVLAAGWTGALSLPDIAAQMERGAYLLRSDHSDVPDRHSSVGEVLGQSWADIRVRQQPSLAALSVFRGGFSRDAAGAIADVDPTQLREWTDRSWLQVEAGRYRLHPITRGFLAERLAPPDRERSERRHARHFAAQLETQGALLIGPTAAAAMHKLSADRENIRAAWERSARAGWAAEIARAAHGLYEFLDIARAHPERTELLALAVSELTPDSEGDPVAAIARLRCEVMLVDDIAGCEELLARMRTMASDAHGELDHALALSRASRFDPDIDSARQRWRDAASIYRRLGRHGLEGSADLRFAERLEAEWRFVEMREVLEHAAGLFDLAGSPDHAAVAEIRRARALASLGEVEAMRAEMARVRADIRRSHPAVRRYLRVEWLAAHLRLALNQGLSVRARRLVPPFREAKEAVGENPAESLFAYARIAEAEGDPQEALACWREALHHADLDRLTGLLGVARTRLALGQAGGATVALAEARAYGGDGHALTLIELARWLAVRGQTAVGVHLAAAIERYASGLPYETLRRRAARARAEIRGSSVAFPAEAASADPLADVATDAWQRFDAIATP